MLDLDPQAPTALVDFPDPTAPDAPRWRWRFGQPTRWLVAHDPAQVAPLLDAVHAAARQGQWCVGWVAYEAAPGLNPHLPVKALPPGQPYAVWAVFDEAHPWPGPATRPSGDAPAGGWAAGPWQADLAEPEARDRIEAIRALIRAGEVYQVNLTTRLASTWCNPSGPPQGGIVPWFEALQRSQPQAYSLMLDARAACRAPGVVLSISPELFVDWHGEQLTTRPMKGTAARQPEPQADADAAEALRASDKERAENLMIVDLLRNDLSRVAQVGSVAVPRLFDLEAWPTVWQMTSTITARSRAGLTLSALFGALFPCGSVTGAPKRQAMHHIARLERSPRGVYCGAVGLIQPGGRATFNVPIRTAVLHTPPPDAPWTARCGVGSGITLDAEPAAEVREWRAKQVFLHRADRPFQLLESLRLEDGVLARRELHLARLRRSAAHFAWPWARDPAHTARVMHDIEDALAQVASAHPHGAFKIRLLVDTAGLPQAECAPLADLPRHPEGGLRVSLAASPMPEADDFVRHKTTRREAYAAFQPAPGCVDTLLFNARGELTEFTIGNLALRRDGVWYTPPLSSGLLPGVMRATLLAEGHLTERVLTRDDLLAHEGLALLNSVRGWVDVTLSP